MGTLPLLRPEWFILIAGLVALPISKRAIQTKVAHWLAYVFFAYVLSLVYGVLVMDITLNIRDFTELFKPVLYFLFFLFIASGTFTIIEYRQFLKLTQVAFAMAALIGIIQFLNPGLIKPLLLMYRGDIIEMQNYRLLRAYGTMGNPNILGFLMTIGFALTLFTLRYRILPVRLSQLFILMNFAGVFVSGSRTGMVCLTAVTLIFIAFEIRKNTMNLLFLCGLSFVMIWFFQNILQELTPLQGMIGRVTSLGNVFEDKDGWLPRVEMAKRTMLLIENSWVFGHGPAKAVFIDGGNIDNEYILILYRFGMVGMITTAGLVWVLCTQLSRTDYKKVPLLKSMRNFSLATGVAAAIFAYTAGFFMLFPLFSLAVILWTIPVFVRIQGCSVTNVEAQRLVFQTPKFESGVKSRLLP